MFILAILFAGISLIASKLLAPRRPTASKEDPYECGIASTQGPPERFPVRFFLIGMIFIVFDVEIIFMYPWATVFREIGLFGFVAILIFSFAVFESFLYVIGNGALEWGPRKKIEKQDVFSSCQMVTDTKHVAGNVWLSLLRIRDDGDRRSTL